MNLIDNESEFIDNLESNNFFGYRDYAEISLLRESTEESMCYRCNKPLKPLTWLDPSYYYLPCWDCIGKRKTEKTIATENILKNIKDFYSTKILGDRYFQLFISESKYFSNTIPHDYSIFKKAISSINPPSRNDIWYLDRKPGYPKIISLDNLNGLKLVNLSNTYEISLDKEIIKVGDYEILLPEFVSFDSVHHSRNSIINKNGNRKTKRLKIGERCIKFYNTEKDNVKSIFKLLKNGYDITTRTLTYQDYAVIKLAIMRNKTYLRLVFDILNEILKSVGIYRDSVFLKNTIIIDPKRDLHFNLIWNPLAEKILDNYLNISIL